MKIPPRRSNPASTSCPSRQFLPAVSLESDVGPDKIVSASSTITPTQASETSPVSEDSDTVCDSPVAPTGSEIASNVVPVADTTDPAVADATTALAHEEMVATEADAAAQAALIQSAFPPVLPPPGQIPPAHQSVPPKPTSSAPLASKKEAKMTTTNSLTAHNFCAREWVTNNRNGTRPQFIAYWTALAGTPEEQRWNTQSAKAKADAATNTKSRTRECEWTRFEFLNTKFLPLITNKVEGRQRLAAKLAAQGYSGSGFGSGFDGGFGFDALT
ncbi:hypothetical protein K438DRAFT_1758517 [Mycena galopus ATCC 62051]|nr:hypothetical protein K438DRAFT_1758517 [Mycena galopus ATCC 62051]